MGLLGAFLIHTSFQLACFSCLHRLTLFFMIYITPTWTNKVKQKGHLIKVVRMTLSIHLDRRRTRGLTRAWIHKMRQLGAHHVLMKELVLKKLYTYKQDFYELLTKETTFILFAMNNLEKLFFLLNKCFVCRHFDCFLILKKYRRYLESNDLDFAQRNHNLVITSMKSKADFASS